MVQVDPDREPAAGEVVIFTVTGSFYVKGTVLDVARRLAAEEWPTFELAESGDQIIIRSEHVVALRGGSRAKRGTIGFRPAP